MTAVQTRIDDNGIARIVLGNPRRGNRFDREMMSAINSAVELCDIDRAVRVIIFEGEGDDFSAGADIAWLRRIIDYDYAANRVDAELVASLLYQIYSLRKPTIAKVRGKVIGIGVGLTSACDIAVCDEAASFTFVDAVLGLLPALSAPYVMASVGPKMALRYFVTGEEITAPTALADGLVSQVTEVNQLDSAVDALALSLLRGGPRTIYAMKNMIRALSHKPIDPKLCKSTVDWVATQRTSIEGRNGVGSFIAGQGPPWASYTPKFGRSGPSSPLLGGDQYLSEFYQFHPEYSTQSRLPPQTQETAPSPQTDTQTDSVVAHSNGDAASS